MVEQAAVTSTASDPASEDIHLLDLLTLFARYKRIVIGLPIAFALAAFAGSFLIKPVFESTAKILPPQKQQNSGLANMLGQLGGLAGAAGALGGLKTPGDLYTGILESRTIADKLIVRFRLKQRYDESTMDETRKELAQHSEITNDKKNGLISIKVTDEDPNFAAEMANAYVKELGAMTETLAITEASQRRVFFEKQLKDAKDNLANAEVELKKTQEKTGIIQPTAQLGTIITSIAQLRGTISAKEVQLNSLRTFATSSNPQLLQTQEELRSLRDQLSRLENSQSGKQGDIMVSPGKIPAAGVEYVRAARNVKYYETIFELLAKQYEIARLDEAEDSSVIQMLDPAIAAEKKAKPRRVMIAIAGLIGGLVFGIALALSLEGYRRSRADAAGALRWRRLSAAWKRSSHA
jgi:tyrosine-protein kinase Etk/Wzc